MKKIAIICAAYFQVLHTRFIVEKLREESNIEVTYVNFAPKNVGNHYEELNDYFIKNDEDYCDFFDFFKNSSDYAAIVALHFFPGIQLLSPNIKKIRIQYGYAKDSWNYAEWNVVFDYVFTYGPYASKKLLPMTEVIEVGHPRQRSKYSSLLSDSLDKRLGINNKKTILYCPTWADISSLNMFLEGPIKEISKNYNIFIKLHHNLSLKGIKHMDIEKNIYYFNSSTDIFDLLNISDLVISDYSGAIFDAMLFKKPILLLDTLEEDVLDSGVKGLSKMLNVMEEKKYENTCYSLDIYIRNILKHLKNIEELPKAITNEFNKPISYLNLLNELYVYQDDLAPARISQGIIKILEKNTQGKTTNYKKINTQLIENFLLLNTNNKIAIWGAGELGQIACAWVLSRGFKIDVFFDTDKKKIGKSINKIDVLNPKKGFKVLIAVSGFYKEITRELIERGYKEGKDFIYPF